MAGYGFNTGLDGHRITPLSETEKEEVAEGLKIIYGNARERMLKNVASRMAKGITQYGWAERKSSEILAAHAQLSRDLEHAQKQRESLLSNVMERAYVTGNQKFLSDMRSVLGETAHLSPNSVKAGYILADLNNSLNAAERRILRQFDDKYADVIGSVSSEMATGVMNTRQAVGEALTAFADEGIDGFVDRGGHHWTLENYSEMAVLTAIERSTISGYVDTMESYGYDLAIIDGHAGSCPICAAWEGVIVSVSGNNPDYPSLDDAENDGCFHPRCLHGITTYYEGISPEPVGGFRSEPREIEDPGPQYTARSKQRYMERMIRKYKDRAIVAQTPQQKMMAANKLKQWEDALDDLIEKQSGDNHLYRHGDREKSNLSGASADATKAFLGNATPGNGSVKIEPGYDKGKHKHELAISNVLLKTFGGDITLPDDTGNTSTPDFIWNRTPWELKKVSSKTSADNQTRYATEQFHKRGGERNLILDCQGVSPDLVQRIVLRRLDRSEDSGLYTVMFLRDGELSHIVRHTKR